jgi:hypothetical protein
VPDRDRELSKNGGQLARAWKQTQTPRRVEKSNVLVTAISQRISVMTASWNAVGFDELNAYGGVRRIYERYDPHISCRRVWTRFRARRRAV